MARATAFSLGGSVQKTLLLMFAYMWLCHSGGTSCKLECHDCIIIFFIYLDFYKPFLKMK